MIKRIYSRLTKQKDMSPRLGGLINVYSSTAVIYSPLTFVGVATTLFGLWGADAIKEWLPWFTFGHMVAVMVLFILLLMILFYKVVIPSMYAFQMQQQYKHRNPLVADVQEVLEELAQTNERLKETNDRLDGLEKLIKEQS